MGLSLVVGPAHAGKVALLLERYLDVSSAIRGLSCPTARRRACRARSAPARSALLAGRSGRSTTSSSSRGRRSRAARVAAMRSARSLRGARSRARALDDARALRRGSRGSPTRCCPRSASSSRLCSIPSARAATSDARPAYRDELDRLGLWDRDGLRRRAAERMQSDLGAWDGSRLRLRLRGPDRRRMGAIEALAARTDVTVSIPYEPGAPPSRRSSGRSSDLARPRCRAFEELPPVERPARAAAARPSRARAFGDGPAPGGARGLGATSSKEREPRDGRARRRELLGLVRAGTPPDRIGIVCESPERWRATFESVLGPLGIPYAIEHPLRLGETPARRRAARAPPLRLARRRPRGAVRVPALAVLRPRAPLGRLRRRPPAGSRDRGPGAGRGGDREAARSARPRTRRAPRRRDPVAAVRTFLRLDDSERLGARRAPGRRRRARRCARYQAVRAPSTSSRRSRSGRARLAARTSSRRSSERRSGRSRRRSGRVAVLDYERARTRTLRRRLPARPGGGEPSAAGPALAVARRRRRGAARRAARAAGHRRARPLPLLHRLHAGDPPARPRSRGRDRRGRPARAEPVLGRRPRALRQAEVARATRRRPLSSLTWTLDSAPSERERLRAFARLTIDDAGGAEELASANGWSRRLERARHAFDRPTTLSSPPCSSRCRARRCSRRPSSSVSPTARRPGSSSG